MNEPWTTCPSCGWNYERHGDTHMSTRFNCSRSRNVGNGNTGNHNGLGEVSPVVSIDERSALWQMDEIKTIMAERGINFGDAVNVYIDRQRPPVDTSGWDAA